MDEELPLVNRDAGDASESLQQQLSSYHQRQRDRQKRRTRTRTAGRATVGFLAASLLALLLVALSWPAQRHNSRSEELSALLGSYQEAKNFSGVVRLSHNGQKKLQMAMGKANVPLNDAMEEDSVFPMGAHVQLVTAVALYQLQERRAVRLQDPVNKYLTPQDWQEFGAENQTRWCPKVENSDDCEEITFQQLMYMGSGIKGGYLLKKRPLYALGTLGSQIGSFINAPLAFKPGTNYSYSEDNYVLLAYMVEKLSGLSFGEYLQKHIFRPLELKHTSYDPYAGALGVPENLVDEYVQYYAYRKPNGSASQSDSDSDSGSSGPTHVVEKKMHHMATGTCQLYQDLGSSVQGLQSTARDMHKLYNDLFQEHGRHSKLLKAKSIAQMVTTRNSVYPAFAQGVGVNFKDDANPAGKTSNGAAWPSKIAFCGSTACTTTCMAMQMPAANMSLVASAFTNDVRLYFPSVEAFHAYKPRDFLEKREPRLEKDGFKKSDGEVNTLAWSLLEVFLRYYADPSD